MASRSEVDAAVRSVIERFAAVDPEIRRRLIVERTVSCHVVDLGVTWSGRLCPEGLCDVTTQDGERAQVRLQMSSDDLVALTEGRLLVPAAWASGRLRVEAGVLDLLKLRALL